MNVLRVRSAEEPAWVFALHELCLIKSWKAYVLLGELITSVQRRVQRHGLQTHYILLRRGYGSHVQLRYYAKPLNPF